ncbi:MAG: hypothetical protein KBC64_06120 [Simkaniaceae bacterium]|nr:hypothetical protein [Simkaniaceae bacterium]
MESLSFYDRHELTCHLTDAEVGRLEIALSRIPPISVDQLCSDLESTAPFQGEFWSRYEYKTWPLVAFAALKAKRCTVDEFATISLLFAALKEFVYTETYYSMRSLRPIFWETHRFDKEGFKDKGWRPISPSSPEYGKYLKIFFRRWNQEGELRLERALAKLAPSDRYLFEIEMPRTSVEYWGPMIKAIKLATQDHLYPFLEEGLNILGCAEKRQLVLPAFPVLRLFSELVNLAMPICMIPRIGTMKESDIVKDRFCFSHVVALEMDEIPLPIEADGHPTGPFAFGLHDIYHTFTYATRLSKMIFLATNRMIQVLRPSIFFNDPTLDRLIARLIDAEFMNDYPIEGYLVGHLFNNRHLKDAWDARCGLYKRVILADIARHRPFWNYICNDNMGLSPEDMALVPPDPNPTFPRDDELIALGMGDELLSFFKMAHALNWTSSEMRKGVDELTGDDSLERDRYRLCISLFTHLPLEKSKEEISFIKEVPCSHIFYLDYWKDFLIQGRSVKTLDFILSSHFTIADVWHYSLLFRTSWDHFEQLVNLLDRSHGKALHEGSFTLDEWEMLISSGHKGVLSALLEQTERCNLSKKELVALLPDSLS